MTSLAYDIFWRDHGAAKGADQLGDKLDRAAKRSSAFGTAVKAGAAIAGVALLKFGSDSLKAYTEAEQAQTRLQDAFARFPDLADSNIDRMRRLNEQLAKKTRFDEDALASGQAVLAQFKLSGGQLEALTPLLADYAAKTGKDLPGAASTLGKAFLGNTRALKELGINYKATGDRAKDQAAITKLLREQVGGFAEKEGATAAGKTAILKNQFGELQETVGSKLLPVLLRATDIGLGVVSWIDRNNSAALALVGVVGVLGGAVLAVGAATRIWAAAQLLARGATLSWTAAQWLLNVALNANPIGLVVIGIAALAAIFVVAWKKSETFRRIVLGAFDGIKIAATIAKDWVLDKLTALGSFFTKFPGRLKTAIRPVTDILFFPFKTAFNAIATMWNRTVGRISFQVPDWVPKIGGKGFDIPDIPTLGRGGIVPATPGGRIVRVAEAGQDEEIRPLPRGGRGPGGGDTFVINIGTVIGTGLDEAAEQIHAALLRKKRRGAVIGLA